MREDAFENARQAIAEQANATDKLSQAQSARVERHTIMENSLEGKRVLQGLKHSRSTVREEAVLKIDALNVEVPTELAFSMLQDTSWAVRSWAVGLLKQRKDDNTLYVLKVVPLLTHKEEFIKESALE